ncbi:tail fiber assembly protein [Morganella psychrotolerans]|uniref:tail fiber assembly protein n=1 Tax=Morganella psychrotolerans TaxID=368603 RepID=UPI0039AF95E0
MRYYKDSENKIYAFEDNINAEDWLNFKVAEITESKADEILNPPLTKEQLIEQAEAKKQFLIAEVNAETEMLRAKLALGRIKEDEKALLNAWLDYLDELEAVDVSTAPDIIWPVKPVA